MRSPGAGDLAIGDLLLDTLISRPTCDPQTGADLQGRHQADAQPVFILNKPHWFVSKRLPRTLRVLLSPLGSSPSTGGEQGGLPARIEGEWRACFFHRLPRPRTGSVARTRSRSNGILDSYRWIRACVSFIYIYCIFEKLL